MTALSQAADALLAGGVVAYPTEGVFGLGCMPDDDSALLRLLAIKRRPASKGLILIAAEPAMFEGWVSAEDLERLPEVDPRRPITWIARPGPRVGPLLRGEHAGIAVRITTNPIAARLTRAVDSPITSTSANISGRPVARNAYILRRTFGSLVDFIVPGDCGPATAPSEIRSLESGHTLRSAGT